MPRSRRNTGRPQRPATPRALAQFQSDLDRIVTAGLPSRMPDVLYHYTTWGGFRGIVSSQQFHARIHRRTNDPAEIASLDEILTDIGTDLARTVTGPLREPLVAFLGDLPERRIGKIANVYLACFSVARDKASQWEAYADGGRGVCLGLRVLHDEKPPPHPPYPHLASMPVGYDEDAWRVAVRNKFQRVLACLARFGRRYKKGYAHGIPTAWSALMRIGAFASIQAKRPEFQSEEEWRTVAMDYGELTPELKPDGSPYVPLVLREPPLRLVFAEIMLGPRQELAAADAIAAARSVLEDAGYSEDEVPPITVSVADISERAKPDAAL